MKKPDSLVLADDLRRIGCLAASNELIRLHEANQAMLEALKDARNQLESYEFDLNGDSYNDLTINAAIAKGEQQ